MKWNIQIEFTPDRNKPIQIDVGTITRPIADLHPEQNKRVEKGRFRPLRMPKA